MKLRVLKADDVSRALPHKVCVDALRAAMQAVSSGNAVLPLRQTMPIPGSEGKLVLMPGYLDPGSAAADRRFGVKIVSKYPRPAGDPHGTHVGMVVLMDAAVGLPMAIMDGGRLTAIRTSAATALATDVLARKESKTALFIGHGEEAQHHLSALLTVRALEKVMVWGRSPEKARAFVDAMAAQHDVALEVVTDAESGAGQADIICTLTSATKPIFKGAWLRPGQHINMVGAAVATSAEVDSETVVRTRWYTDYKPSLDAQGGEWIDAKSAGLVDDDHLIGEIGAVLAGNAPGRTDHSQITAYKSLGVTAQDLSAAEAALRAADADNIGQVIDW